MRNILLTTMVCLISVLASAQTIRYGDSKVTISNVEKKERSYELYERKYKSIEYTGSYPFTKGSEKISAEFSTMRLNGGAMHLKVMDKDGYGNTLDYDFDTRLFTWDGKEFKVTNANTVNDIILEGIYFYFKDL